MDAELRSQIIGSVLGKNEIKESNSTPIEEDPCVFNFKDKLAKVHQYEKIIKEDSENWTSEHWKSFEDWLNSRTTSDIVGNVLERKQKRLELENKQLSETRKKLFSKINPKFL